ncbi:MAG TPA: hypothetical protein VHD56_14050 [Tepidisphaeraceae bacterium]|nr:hypothetical protein [Tepidisphaeraceae bacterium]
MDCPGGSGRLAYCVLKNKKNEVSTSTEFAKKRARHAGLRHVTDSSPGIRRIRHGHGFSYIGISGKAVSNRSVLSRIRSLVIPPAWTDVWICPKANGHLQVTGHDERGRKQSKYHPRWREVRDEDKYGHLVEFAECLPKIRQTTRRHLGLAGMPREKVMAAVVVLLEKTCIRVGNDRYAHDNGHYGLTTIENKHVKVNGNSMHFKFIAKSGKPRDVSISDPRLAKIVSKSQYLPGQQLFGYVDDDGRVHDVKSEHVNDYLREITNQEITAKDFRTWTGTVLAARALERFGKCESSAQAKKNIVRAVTEVAEQLGNTRAVCRKCYIHPAILDGYSSGKIIQTTSSRPQRKDSLRNEEAAVVRLLRDG